MTPSLDDSRQWSLDFLVNVEALDFVAEVFGGGLVLLVESGEVLSQAG
jgi:hypothetical protein